MRTSTPFSVTEEQRALCSAVADLMARHSSEAQVRTLMATDTGLDPKAWHELAAMGLTGLHHRAQRRRGIIWGAARAARLVPPFDHAVVIRRVGLCPQFIGLRGRAQRDHSPFMQDRAGTRSERGHDVARAAGLLERCRGDVLLLSELDAGMARTGNAVTGKSL